MALFTGTDRFVKLAQVWIITAQSAASRSLTTNNVHNMFTKALFQLGLADDEEKCPGVFDHFNYEALYHDDDSKRIITPALHGKVLQRTCIVYRISQGYIVAANSEVELDWFRRSMDETRHPVLPSSI